MSMEYATETTQASAQVLNQNWFSLIEGGQQKVAEEAGNAFVRQIVRQECAFRKVLPPINITPADLDRSEVSLWPRKIIEIEPDSEATYADLTGTPETRWINGQAMSVMFYKVMSTRYVQSKFAMMQWQNDIRKILADNARFDIADQEDYQGRRLMLSAVNKNPSVQRTAAGAFTSSAFTKAFAAMAKRRLGPAKLLLTEALFYSAIDLPHSQIGDEATKHYREGIENEQKLFGKPAISTIKADIYSPTEAWVVAPASACGKFFTLQDVTLFIKQEADVFEFFEYEAIGIGWSNRKAVQQITFSSLGT